MSHVHIAIIKAEVKDALNDIDNAAHQEGQAFLQAQEIDRVTRQYSPRANELSMQLVLSKQSSATNMFLERLCKEMLLLRLQIAEECAAPK